MGNANILCALPPPCHYSSSSRRFGRSKVNGTIHMSALTTHHRPEQRSFLNELSVELLILVFEKLRDVDSRSLGAARMVSRKFNAIVTPIRYHTLRLTEKIISSQAEIYLPAGIAHICAYTRHLKVDSHLCVNQVKQLLNRLERLSMISWRYAQNNLSQGSFWVPSDIISLRHIQSGRVKLYVENLPLQDFQPEQDNHYLRAIPTSALVSLKMAVPTPPLTARVESLKGLLLNSPRLETLWYEDRGQGTQFRFAGNERLPALKELSLRSYDWNHSPAVVHRHWDFSQIRRLEIVDVPLGPFLSSVLFTDFQDLETLRLEDSSMHLPDRRRDSTRGQYILIKQIRALVDLKITCHTQAFPVDGLLQHAKSLESLRFRDYVGFCDEHYRCPTLRLEDLDIMSRGLTNLRTLELDMDERVCASHRFLRSLCHFRRLHTLVLHTQTVLTAIQDMDLTADPDRERSMQRLAALVRDKQGASWRSITINVGGWKPIMVRRLSGAWRKHNSRGVFAERCFVMERQENGAFAMREVLPTGSSP